MCFTMKAKKVHAIQKQTVKGIPRLSNFGQLSPTKPKRIILRSEAPLESKSCPKFRPVIEIPDRYEEF